MHKDVLRRISDTFVRSRRKVLWPKYFRAAESWYNLHPRAYISNILYLSAEPKVLHELHEGGKFLDGYLLYLAEVERTFSRLPHSRASGTNVFFHRFSLTLSLFLSLWAPDIPQMAEGEE